MSQKKRVCVVGSGIAGLSCAYLIAESPDFEVTLIEREKYHGMDAKSVQVEGCRIDTPVRVVAEAYYPLLMELYKEIGIELHLASTAFSLSSLGGNAFFKYFSLESQRKNAPSIAFPIPISFSFKALRLVFAWLYFIKNSKRDLLNGNLKGVSLGAYLNSKSYSREFIHDMLVPMYMVVCTCSPEAVLAYPAEILVEYSTRHGVSSANLRSAKGTQDVVERFISKVAHIFLETSVTGIKRNCSNPNGSVQISYLTPDGKAHTAFFDEVVVATQANAAIKLLTDASEEEKTALNGFPYESSQVVVHTDTKLMPPPSDRQPCNLIVSEDGRCMFTCIMNRVSPRQFKDLTHDVYQTWNPILQSDPAKTYITEWFERPVLNTSSEKTTQRLAAIQGLNNTWFCGAYSLYSVPLLENGVRSSIKVAQGIGAKHPWLQCHCLNFTCSCPAARRRERGYYSLQRLISISILLGGGVYLWNPKLVQSKVDSLLAAAQELLSSVWNKER